MNKFRRHQVKRQHHIVPDVLELLERVAGCELVHAVLPGEIHPNSAQQVSLTFQYFTDTGLKLLARGTSAIQEVFVVTADPEGTHRWLVAQRLLAEKPPAQPGGKGAPAAARSHMVLAAETPCAACGRPMRAGSRAALVGQGKRARPVHTYCARAGSRG